MGQSQCCRRRCDFRRFRCIRRLQRLSMAHATKPATAGTYIPQDQERGGPALPTLGLVRTSRALTDGVKIQFFNQRLCESKVFLGVPFLPNPCRKSLLHMPLSIWDRCLDNLIRFRSHGADLRVLARGWSIAQSFPGLEMRVEWCWGWSARSSRCPGKRKETAGSCGSYPAVGKEVMCFCVVRRLCEGSLRRGMNSWTMKSSD